MRRVDGDYMARLLVAFPRDTSTVLDQKKVCFKPSQSMFLVLIQYQRMGAPDICLLSDR
jgi:hypothetical protein